MRSSIKGVFLESCNDACRVTKNCNINLFKLSLKESGWKTVLFNKKSVAALRNFQCNVLV